MFFFVGWCCEVMSMLCAYHHQISIRRQRHNIVVTKRATKHLNSSPSRARYAFSFVSNSKNDFNSPWNAVKWEEKGGNLNWSQVFAYNVPHICLRIELIPPLPAYDIAGVHINNSIYESETTCSSSISSSSRYLHTSQARRIYWIINKSSEL